jgi:hypothetical protein
MYIHLLIFVTLSFSVYSELMIGNIALRPDSSGKIVLNIWSLFNFLIDPLFNRFLWNFELLPCNYIFIILFYTIIYCSIICIYQR